MKFVNRSINSHNEGSITLIAEEQEDLWHVYNIIREGDMVTAVTFRKKGVAKDGRAHSTSSKSSERVRITLTLEIEKIDFDSDACELHLIGKCMNENDYVILGSYHKIDLELKRKFTITKDEWDSVALERIDQACDPAAHADVAAVIMQEGLAFICLITNSMTLVRSKIEVSIPRKYKGYTDQQDKAVAKFHDQVMQGILRHVNFDLVKCLIIASPRFVKDKFLDYVKTEAVKCGHKVLLENQTKLLPVHATTGFLHSLNEVLQDPTVKEKILDTKAHEEVKILNEFYEMLNTNPSRAFYGKKHVLLAHANGAIETLLISDELFRSNDIKLRKEYVKLVESIKNLGGNVKIFSSMHNSGERLNQLTGIAAILRIPMPELEDIDPEDGSDGES